MGFKEDNADALEALAWHEASIAEYYKACAGLSDECAELWRRLAQEEEAHSAALLSAKDLTKDAESPLFEKEAIDLALVESSTKFVRRELERLKAKPGYSLVDALAVALKIEGSFFERHVFEAFKGSPSIKLQQTARTLGAETQEHAKTIAKRLQELKEARAELEREEEGDGKTEEPSKRTP